MEWMHLAIMDRDAGKIDGTRSIAWVTFAILYLFLLNKVHLKMRERFLSTIVIKEMRNYFNYLYGFVDGTLNVWRKISMS